MPKQPDPPIYFQKLSLENVRCFGESQELRLTDDGGRPARWTLIIGDNGAGKTTLLQCLARMRPRFNPPPDNDSGQHPNRIEPALNSEENNELSALARFGSDAEVRLEASLSVGLPLKGQGSRRHKTISTGLAIRRKEGDITDVVPNGNASDSVEEPPFVVGYGAGRHPRAADSHRPAETDPLHSLFSVESELYDAEKNLCDLEYASLTKSRSSEERQRAKKLLDSLTHMLAGVLPDVQRPQDVRIYGPRSTVYVSDRAGVHVRTRSGEVPLDQLGLGYRTVFAWTMDIAWRLIERYPTSSTSLEEPAIVIVDEIDLHLHPRWQREIRDLLTGLFPNVQFIATAHSPLMVQSSLDKNLAVVRWQDDHVTIENDPVAIENWRLDQLVTSDLFGLNSARSPDVERNLKRRSELLEKSKLSLEERTELNKLNHMVHGMPTAESPADDRAMEIIRQAAARLPPPEGGS